MCKVLVTDGMNKNAIDRLRKFNIDIEHKFYDGMELGEKLKDKDIKSLRLIPIKYIGEENRILDIYDIDKLPITFEMNEYGKVIIEDIQINDSKIIYTYYTEGFVPYESGLVFFDENEKEIGFSCSSSENKNKKTGRITTTINLEGYGNDLNLISKIKKVSAYNNTKMRLLYDEAIEINLSN